MRDLTPEQVKQAEQRWTVSANTPRVQYAPERKPPVIHVVTPESSSGKLWAEVQRLQAVEAESARTVAHLNQAHREVSDMQKARIDQERDAMADLQGRLWCALGQPLAIDPVQAVRDMKARIAELEKALTQIGDCREHPQCTHARLARKTIAKSAGMKPEAL